MRPGDVPDPLRGDAGRTQSQHLGGQGERAPDRAHVPELLQRQQQSTRRRASQSGPAGDVADAQLERRRPEARDHVEPVGERLDEFTVAGVDGVYAYLATTIGKVFFPAASGTAQLLSTFAIFAAAFVVRPLGGLFFGPLGDRVGARRCSRRP